MFSAWSLRASFPRGIGKRGLGAPQNFGALMAEVQFGCGSVETRSVPGFREKPRPIILDRKRNRAGQ